jgi:glucokinase
MDTYIAVDIGGTKIRVASYPEQGIQPVQQKRISTRSKTSSAVERMIELIAELWPESGSVAGIAVAAPGPIDPEKGIIYSAPNIPGWENLYLRDILADRFQVPVRLGNDANLAALGEWQYGAGRGHCHVLYFTISTGIGGGVISDGQLLLGQKGLAAELGHVTIDPNGPLCSCGKHGHLEALSSGTAIAKFVASELQRGVPSILSSNPLPSAVDIANAAAQGDPLAVAAFNRAGHYLGLALSNYLQIFNPSITIFGGGVSRTGSLLFDPMRRTLEQEVLSPAYLKNLTIATAELGDDSGLLGALALARQK